MGVDHSNAFVRIWFDGLIAFCFTKRKGGNCEMGMVQAADHVPLLILTRINPNGTKTEVKHRELGSADNIKIEAKNPVESGVSTFHASGLDNLADTGDPEDFRWIVDLQGNHFHGKDLKLKQDSRNSLLRPRITIPHGLFYTSEKTPDRYRRIKHRGNTNNKHIGKIADKVGADIVCLPEGGVVEVTIGSEKPFTLYRDSVEGKGFRYWIEISNLCRRTATDGPTCPAASDFTHYYEAASDDNGIEYDLQVAYPEDDPRGITPVEDSQGLKGFRSNGPPQVCNSIFLSQTSSIP